MIRKFFHYSSFNFNAKEGDVIVLKPGTQNAQGKGVYFSEGKADERASDSCYENGVATIFVLDVEATTNGDWWYSKGSADRKKNRPKTWHSNGANVIVRVTKVDGIYVYGTGERTFLSEADVIVDSKEEVEMSTELLNSLRDAYNLCGSYLPEEVLMDTYNSIEDEKFVTDLIVQCEYGSFNTHVAYSFFKEEKDCDDWGNVTYVKIDPTPLNKIVRDIKNSDVSVEEARDKLLSLTYLPREISIYKSSVEHDETLLALYKEGKMRLIREALGVSGIHAARNMVISNFWKKSYVYSYDYEWLKGIKGSSVTKAFKVANTPLAVLIVNYMSYKEDKNVQTTYP